MIDCESIAGFHTRLWLICPINTNFCPNSVNHQLYLCILVVYSGFDLILIFTLNRKRRQIVQFMLFDKHLMSDLIEKFAKQFIMFNRNM